MTQGIRLRAKNRVKKLFEKNEEKWITCTHRDLVQLAFEFDLGVNQVAEIYYRHFMKRPI